LTKAQQPFWKTKRLEDMSQQEWESLCDGCGRCCLVKLEDEESGEIHLTRLSCRLLNVKSCRCTKYPQRFEHMSDCVDLTLDKIGTIKWLPHSCAYRRLQDGRDLAWWHPLVSGDPQTVHDAGISVRSFAMTEARVKEENYQRYIIEDFETEPA